MRTHWCGELRHDHVGTKVVLTGWVHRRRDHGGVIFLDLRDREGIAQIVLHPTEQPEAYKIAEKVRSEYLLKVKGEVRARIEGAVNPNLPTGEVEVAASAIEVIARSETPPFPIEDGVDVSEEVRLRYRYLDLRRPQVQKTIMMRHNVVKTIRSFLDAEEFVEIETPNLTKATPEGARDFLVPSRLQPGSFWALPQSPQLFKQLLMIAGFDRYYQIARCFRDEDPRADRLLDFTQLDLEMSFATEEDIRDLTERLFQTLFDEVLGVKISIPFPIMSFDDSVARYGTDKPDIRFDLPIQDVTGIFENTQIKIFEKVLVAGGSAKAIKVPGQAGMSRKDLGSLVTQARNMRAGGMAWVALTDEGISSPLAKVLSKQETGNLVSEMEAQSGDLILIVCDRRAVAEAAMGAVRTALGRALGLVPNLPPEDPSGWKFLWVNDAPLVTWNESESRWDPVHHPFTAPKPEELPLLDTDPGAVHGQCYDIVLNGVEMGGGSIRIHSPELQRRIFELIGLDEATVERRFGWFVRAFDFGAPPHGGIAPGIDRIVWLMSRGDSIRDAIAFPKSGSYTDPMTGAPDSVDPKQLEELFIKSISPPEA